jgi:excisionase family DNA binding protein
MKTVSSRSMPSRFALRASLSVFTSMENITNHHESWRESIPVGMLTSYYRAYKAELESLREQQQSREPLRKSNRKASVAPRGLKTNEAAAYLGVSPWKLRNLVQAGEISYIAGDGTSPWLFDKQELDHWVETRKQRL